MTAWRLLLTRPAEDCAALAQTLAGHGIFGHCLPLLAIETLPETPEQRALFLDLDRYCAVVAVSKPAARLGLERLDRYWPQPPMRQRWFAVGAATGALLDAYGLDAHWPEAGDDSEALLALPALQQAIAVPQPRVADPARRGAGATGSASSCAGRGRASTIFPCIAARCPTTPPAR